MWTSTPPSASETSFCVAQIFWKPQTHLQFSSFIKVQKFRLAGMRLGLARGWEEACERENRLVLAMLVSCGYSCARSYCFHSHSQTESFTGTPGAFLENKYVQCVEFRTFDQGWITVVVIKSNRYIISIIVKSIEHLTNQLALCLLIK